MEFKRNILLLLVGVWPAIATGPLVAQLVERPNFVFLISEDTSKHHLSLFDEHGTDTPNIKRLANEGLTYSYAFSNSPVCSVARTTLMTGCYPTRIGAHHHRSNPKHALPDGLKMFPAYLREAGYYATNRQKTDYNVQGGREAWDESSREATWRNRAEGQPFFHMQSFPVSHEGRLHFPESDVEEKPAAVPLDSVFVNPRHPDTDLFRYTRARYHEQVQKMDQQIGNVVRQLADDGLLDSTFVFYFGDHGGVLPGSKTYLYETGLHVPLVIRIPENFRQPVQFPIRERVSQFVSFVDFGPTLLNLAGIARSPIMNGQPFLGPGTSPADNQNIALGFADRFDEKIDMARSVRIGNFKYIRNYLPYYPNGLHNNYRYRMAAYRQWRESFALGQLNEIQSLFFHRRPSEELYDVKGDPYETRNLAGALPETLSRMRNTLAEHLESSPDLGFYPESFLVTRPELLYDFGTSSRNEIRHLADIADLALQPFEVAEPQIMKFLESTNPWERYWALIACTTMQASDDDLQARVQSIVADDKTLLIRMRAAEYLALAYHVNPADTMLELLAATRSGHEATEILNSIVMLRDSKAAFDISVTLESMHPSVREYDGVKRRLEYLAGL